SRIRPRLLDYDLSLLGRHPSAEDDFADGGRRQCVEMDGKWACIDRLQGRLELAYDPVFLLVGPFRALDEEMLEQDLIGLRDARARTRVSDPSGALEILILQCVPVEFLVAWIDFNGDAAVLARIMRPQQQIIGRH